MDILTNQVVAVVVAEAVVAVAPANPEVHAKLLKSRPTNKAAVVVKVAAVAVTKPRTTVS